MITLLYYRANFRSTWAKNGLPGKPQTEEANAKRSAKLKGRVSPMKGRTYTMSEETKRKISEALKGKTKGA